MTIVGMVGFAASGKDSTAKTLINEYGYVKDSWASPLKDSVASIFGWDRAMVEGETSESRKWREQVDEWWANRLGIAHLTPRWVLQLFGTEVIRQGFHQEIWVASLENRVRMKTNVVITDCRFPNEITAVHKLGGVICRIRRYPDPTWVSEARDAFSKGGDDKLRFENYLKDELKLHASEWSWVGCPVDITIDNYGTLDDLAEKARNLAQWLSKISVSRAEQKEPTSNGV